MINFPNELTNGQHIRVEFTLLLCRHNPRLQALLFMRNTLLSGFLLLINLDNVGITGVSDSHNAGAEVLTTCCSELDVV